MKKSTIIIFIILIVYLILSLAFKPFIPCIIHEITGLYCPGCGLSRMILSIIRLDFYQAFRYNPLLFILFPFGLILVLEYLYSLFKKRTPIYEKINNKVWIILIVILIIYGIVRNIYIPLSPIKLTI